MGGDICILIADSKTVEKTPKNIFKNDFNIISVHFTTLQVIPKQNLKWLLLCQKSDFQAISRPFGAFLSKLDHNFSGSCLIFNLFVAA